MDYILNRVRSFTKGNSKSWKEFLINNAIYLVMLCGILVVIIMEPTFLSLRVFTNILTMSSVRLILAFGVGGIIILQGTDLSLGRAVGFATVISASLLQASDYTTRFYPDLFLTEWPVVFRLLLPLIVAMLAAGLCSALNGWVAAVFKIHPFIVTLGSSVILYGLLTIYYNSAAGGGQPIGGLDPAYSTIVGGYFMIFGFRLPYLVIYAAIVSVIMWIIWNKTTFGKNMFAVGGNPDAAQVSGVNVVKTFVLVYLVAGLLYGLGGFLEAARIGSANNSTGFGYELDAIAACVVGGISFSGGTGKISGAITGVLLFSILSYGMTFLGLGFEYQNIIKGLVIVIAVALDTRKYIKKT